MTNRDPSKTKTNMQVKKETLDKFGDFCYAYGKTRDEMLKTLMEMCQKDMEKKLQKKVVEHTAAMMAENAPTADES